MPCLIDLDEEDIQSFIDERDKYRQALIDIAVSVAKEPLPTLLTELNRILKECKIGIV